MRIHLVCEDTWTCILPACFFLSFIDSYMYIHTYSSNIYILCIYLFCYVCVDEHISPSATACDFKRHCAGSRFFGCLSATCSLHPRRSYFVSPPGLPLVFSANLIAETKRTTVWCFQTKSIPATANIFWFALTVGHLSCSETEPQTESQILCFRPSTSLDCCDSF